MGGTIQLVISAQSKKKKTRVMDDWQICEGTINAKQHKQFLKQHIMLS